MTTSNSDTEREQSTSFLLDRSEEKEHALIDVVVYGLITLSVVAAIVQCAEEVLSFRG